AMSFADSVPSRSRSSPGRDAISSPRASTMSLRTSLPSAAYEPRETPTACACVGVARVRTSAQTSMRARRAAFGAAGRAALALAARIASVADAARSAGRRRGRGGRGGGARRFGEQLPRLGRAGPVECGIERERLLDQRAAARVARLQPDGARVVEEPGVGRAEAKRAVARTARLG